MRDKLASVPGRTCLMIGEPAEGLGLSLSFNVGRASGDMF